MGPLAALFISTSLQFNLPPGLLASICYVETGHNIEAIHYRDGSSRNSIGVCQIQLRTAQWLGFKGTEEQLMAPAVNIYYAAAYLNYQRQRYNSIDKAVIAYNYGHAKDLQTTGYQVKVYKVWKQGDAN